MELRASLHFSPRGETKCGRCLSVRGTRRLATPHSINEAYSDSSLSTASKRNELVAGLLPASAVRW